MDNKINTSFSSIRQIQDQYLNNNSKDAITNSQFQTSFESILQSKSIEADDSIKFSKHAAKRLDERNITLSSEQNTRLEEGLQKASQKGINDSLVLMDSLAFIVNVPNKTVVTAMDQSENEADVFTNIDGAVIV